MVTGSINGQGTGTVIGGIVGRGSGIIERCLTDIQFSNIANHGGGIAGRVNNTQIRHCRSLGSMTGNGGGIAGFIDSSGTVNNCSSLMDINGGATGIAGGIAQEMDWTGATISACFAGGEIQGRIVGGIVGRTGITEYFIERNFITDSFTHATVIVSAGDGHGGGAVGQAALLKMENVLASGSVSGNEGAQLGGLVGSVPDFEDNTNTVINGRWVISSSGQATSALGTGIEGNPNIRQLEGAIAANQREVSITVTDSESDYQVQEWKAPTILEGTLPGVSLHHEAFPLTIQFLVQQPQSPQ